MTKLEMAQGMARLGVAFRTDITEPLVQLYYERISARLDGDQWRAVVDRYIDSGDRYFPTISQLLAMAITGVPAARAAEDYRDIVDHYRDGMSLSYRKVEAEYNHASAEAFTAAGGHAAFEWCEPSNEPFRRKAFIDAWLVSAKEDPSNALCPLLEEGQPQKALK